MNIYDISKRAGVSIATVSRVLNNSLHVSEKTRQHVLGVIQEAGFVPNAFARGLGLNSMKTIGLLCPDASDAYLAHALALLEHAFRIHQYDCMLICTGRDRSDLDAGVMSLASRHVDGIVLMGSTFVGAHAEENKMILETAKDIPTVILNGSFPGNTVYSVMCNDAQATAMAVDFLVAEGRRKPLYVYHSLNESGIKKRSGYREGVQKHALSVGPEHEIFTDGMSKDVTSVARLITEKWNSGLRFDSVITSEDILAVGALKSLHALGLRIPEDISIIGYNNSDLCLCTDPELSSIDNRLPVICERIVETMVHVLEGTEMPIQTVFNAQLVERESTLHSPQKQKGKET